MRPLGLWAPGGFREEQTFPWAKQIEVLVLLKCLDKKTKNLKTWSLDIEGTSELN